MIPSSELLQYLGDGTADGVSSLYRRNPFRILDLDVAATPNDVVKRKSSLERRLRLGVETVAPTDGSLRNSPLDEDALNRALHRLAQPHLRLLDESLWFWATAANGAPSNLADAVARFRAGEVDAAFGIWDKIVKNKGAARAAASHDAAVAAHVLAVEASQSTAPPDDRTLAAWRRARELWDQVCDGGCARISDRLQGRVKKLEDPRFSAHLANEVSDAIPVVIASTFALQARAWHRAGWAEPAKRLLAELESSSLPGSTKDDARGLVVEPIRRRASERVNLARAADRDNPRQLLEVANALISDGKTIVEDLRLVLPADDILIMAVGNELAAAAVSLLVDYGKTVEDWGRHGSLLDQARQLPHGEELAAKFKTEIDTVARFAKRFGAWYTADAPLPAELDRRVMVALAQGVKKRDWNGCIQGLERCLLDAYMTGDAAVAGAMERAYAYGLGSRGIATIATLNEINERPTAVMTSIRNRRRAEAEARRLRTPDTGPGGLLRIQPLSIQGTMGFWNCAACDKGVHEALGHGYGTLQLDGSVAKLCLGCIQQHKSTLEGEKDERQKLFRQLVQDLTWSNNLVPEATDVFDCMTKAITAAAKEGLPTHGCAAIDLAKKLQTMRKEAAREAVAGTGKAGARVRLNGWLVLILVALAIGAVLRLLTG